MVGRVEIHLASRINRGQEPSQSTKDTHSWCRADGFLYLCGYGFARFPNFRSWHVVWLTSRHRSLNLLATDAFYNTQSPR